MFINGDVSTTNGTVSAVNLNIGGGSITNGYISNFNGNLQATALSINTITLSGYQLNVNGNVQATSYNATSDERIKTNITDINGSYAVDILRKLEPKKYTYVDSMKKDDFTGGFIGQELEKCMDYTVTKSTNYIPNIYEYADLSNNLLITLLGKTTNDLMSDSLNNPHLRKIKFLDNSKNEIIRTVDKIINNNSFSITEPIYDYSNNQIFVYGQLVDDFHSVNHTSIFTITTAAVKEIDSELQKALIAIENQNKVIENQNSEIKQLRKEMDELRNMVLGFINK